MANDFPTRRPVPPQNRPSRVDSTSFLLGAPEKINNPFRHREPPGRQFRRLLLKGLFGWSLSVVFVAIMFIVFYFFSEKGYNIQQVAESKSDKPVMNLQTKRLFNSIFTGLSLLLGFNVVGSFQAMAANFRWRVLSSMRYGGHTAEEVDLILRMSSYQTCLTLLLRWWKRPRWFIPLLAWVALGFIIQTSIALIGMTINHESEGAVGTSLGGCGVTDFSHFWVRPHGVPAYYEENYRAHLYGETSEFLATGDPDEDEEDFHPDGFMGDRIELVQFREDKGTGKFHYNFTNKADTQWTGGGPIAVKTTRSVSISTVCTYRAIVSRNPLTLALDGKITTTRKELQAEVVNSTTMYISPSLNLNDTELASPPFPNLNTSCGPSCGITEIFHFPANKTGGNYYHCNTTLTSPTPPAAPEFEIPHTFAVRAASAIGASGIVHPFGGINKYNPAAFWSLDPPDAPDVHTAANPNVTAAEFMVSRFAVGTIAMMDKHGLQIIAVTSDSPWLGTILVVNWGRAVVICVGILVGQLLFLLATLGCTYEVLVKEESMLVMARLLQGLMKELEGRASASAGKELAEFFGEKRWRYGVQVGEGSAQVAGIIRAEEEGEAGVRPELVYE